MDYIDYYKVLDVERSASKEEISKAYKRLARKYHPDLNKNADAEKKFKELNEAHEVLKDPEKRKRYDMLGANWKQGAPFEGQPGWGDGGVRFDFGNGNGGGFSGSGFSDFFEAFFGGLGGGARRQRSGSGFGGGVDLGDLFGGGAGGAPRQAARGQDVESTLTISLEDAYRGSKKTIELSGGQGTRRYEVKIPKGIRDGERIRLAGQGSPGRGKGGSGDLYLEIHLAPDPRFRVEGKDLVTVVAVAAWDAALGTRLPVPTLEGEVMMKLPPGQSSGQRLRLRGKGMPRPGEQPGDLYAELKVVVPRKLTPEQEQLFDQLRKTSEEA